MNVKKIVGLFAIAFVIYFIIKAPSSAADTVQNIGGILANAANSIVTFFTELV